MEIQVAGVADMLQAPLEFWVIAMMYCVYHDLFLTPSNFQTRPSSGPSPALTHYLEVVQHGS